MKKKEYERPTTQVVELKHVGMLMTSGLRGNRGDDYGDAIEDEWNEE